MWKSRVEKLYEAARNAPFGTMATAIAVLNGLGVLYYMDKNDRLSKLYHQDEIDKQTRHNNLLVVDSPKRVEHLQNKVIQNNRVDSIREEVTELRDLVNEAKNGRFVLVRGPRGVGKTSAIYTAFKDTPGVTIVGPIVPGMNQDQILDRVCQEITGLSGTYQANKHAMAKVTSMYKDISKERRPMIVLIEAAECDQYEQPAALTAAARVLADKFGLIVLIDCCENSCPSSLTGREILVNFEPMSYELMRKLPNYQTIADELEKEGNAEIVLAICGGRPLLLDELLVEIHRAHLAGSKSGVKDFVMGKIAEARDNITVLCKTHGVTEVLQKFQDQDENLSDIFPEGQTIPDLKQVLRKVRRSDRIVLVPATGAVALQLHMGIRNKASFEEIKQWISEQKSSVKSSKIIK